MKYKVFFAAMMATAVTMTTVTGAMAQHAPSKEQRKQVDTARKDNRHSVVPVSKGGSKADTTRKPVKKH
ncbi:hypothetical protein HHL17_11595 [Chitinophaga sp. G-6-1-13]|uniref:Uncharacterized protein n=1 Tax=Chitinophaga fulva TaxID=2728842 RepID=A0A848GPK0_9BACT|nr:hypothetical protein [Chitinophaga fulva]NML37838.1 hypothetical protein [Chitinophaga fulva]